MLLADDIRFMLNLTEEDFPTEDIQKYIDTYTLKIYEYVGGRVDCPKLINSPLFDEVLLAGIACHLSMIHPELILFPSKYEVGDTQEEFSSATLKGIPSWCSRYNDALDALLKSFPEIKNLQTFRRRGLRTHRRWRRDLEELDDIGYW